MLNFERTKWGVWLLLSFSFSLLVTINWNGFIFWAERYSWWRNIFCYLCMHFFSRSLFTLRTRWIKYQVEEGEASPHIEKVTSLSCGGRCQLMPDEDKESIHLIFILLQAEAFLGVHFWNTPLLAEGGFIWPPGFVCMHIFLEYILITKLEEPKNMGFSYFLWNTIFEEHWFRTCQNDTRGPLIQIFFW